MSEPSEEALEMADRFCPRDDVEAFAELAAAMQKLMDERDEMVADMKETIDEWRQRAEAAEAALAKRAPP